MPCAEGASIEIERENFCFWLQQEPKLEDVCRSETSPACAVVRPLTASRRPGSGTLSL